MNRATWENHYAALPADDSVASRCFMALEGVAWEGKRVLDVACRRGKGAFKLSEQVGPQGYVVGVDWREGFVAEAQEAMPAALKRSGLTEANLEFRVAFPEDLAAAALEDNSFDVVYVNNGLAHFADPPRALGECARVLVSGGVLVVEIIAGDSPETGSAAGPACAADQMQLWLRNAGFGQSRIASASPLGEAGAFSADASPAVSLVFHATKQMRSK